MTTPATTDVPAQQRVRGLWVYVISAWYLLTGIVGLASQALVMLYKNHLPPHVLATVNVVDILISAATMVCLLLGAVALFFMKRLALHAFAAAILLNGVQLVRNHVTRGYIVAGGAMGLVGYTFGIVILMSVVVYAWRLRNSGRLA